LNKKIVKTNQSYTYDILKNDLLFLNYEFPFFKINEIWKSTLGEKIIYIKLGEGNKKLFINGAHHANEWMTSLITMMFIETYLTLHQKKEIYKGYDIEELWKNVSLFIVPMVNPDGVNLCLKEKKILNDNATITRPNKNSIYLINLSLCFTLFIIVFSFVSFIFNLTLHQLNIHTPKNKSISFLSSFSKFSYL